MAEREVVVDDATLNQWVGKYAGAVADEAYTKVKGWWVYFYRAVDKQGKAIDFMLPNQRDETAATAFFTKAFGNNGSPDTVNIDRNSSNMAVLFNMNCILAILG